MVQNRFRKVKTRKQLYRWEKYVESRGTQLGHNNYYIFRIMFFQSSPMLLIRGSIIHDIDLRRWELVAKENIDLSTFKAGRW